MNTITNTQIVNFHGTELYLVKHNGQPYTPMKPIVEGMGLDWRTQHRKLCQHGARWGMVEMTIPSKGGVQESSCVPLRKLPGWLMSISPNKVKKPEVRERVIQYQNECDDVLWDYWTKGEATNPRLKTKTALPNGLTLDQQDAIKGMIKAKVEQLPQAKQGKGAMRCWSSLKSKFGCGYKAIPAEQFTEAVSLLARIALEGELLGPEPEQPAIPTIDLAGMEDLPPGRYLVYSEGGRFAIKKLGPVALVPIDHVSAFRRDMNQYMQYGAELLSRMRILHGEANMERLAEPLIRKL